MKKILKQKTINKLFGLAMIVLVLAMGATTAKADTTIMHKVSTATANSPINYNFSLNRNSDLQFIIRLNERTSATINIKETGHDIPTATMVLASTNPNWKYNQSSGIYENKANLKLDSGDYILELRFENDINYDMTVNQKDATAKLSKSKLTITKGFSDTIVVKNGKIKTCTSNNKSVASVNKKGIVTAKKNGNATIKVKLTNGKTLSCKVKVVSNKFSAKKITVDNSEYNTWGMKAYDVSFDKNGNLIVKFMIVNNSYGKIDKIQNFKIAIKNQNKKSITSYSQKIYNVSVDSFKDKTCTVTIPKSALKINRNKIDLRTAKVTISGAIDTNSF